MFKRILLISGWLVVGIIVVVSLVNKRSKFFPKSLSEVKLTESQIDERISRLEQEFRIGENFEKDIELGIYYYLKGPKFYDKAINIFENIWRDGCLDERIFYYLGNMYEFLKLYNFATREYKKYLNNVKDDVEVKIRLANLYYLTKNINDAMALYESILSRDNKNVVSLSNIATIHFENKNYLEAEQYFLKVKDICKKLNITEPKYVNFYLGKIKFINKDYKAAIDFFKRELEINNERNVDVLTFLMNSFYEVKDYDSAREVAEKLIKISPKDKNIKKILNKKI